MIDKTWKANLGIAKAQYLKGVMMSEESRCESARGMRKLRRLSVNLALQVSEARHNCLGLLRDAQEAGEVELGGKLSVVWNSFGRSVESLFDAWTQLAAIEEELP